VKKLYSQGESTVIHHIFFLERMKNPKLFGWNIGTLGERKRGIIPSSLVLLLLIFYFKSSDDEGAGQEFPMRYRGFCRLND
jgi:hypothetical protein